MSFLSQIPDHPLRQFIERFWICSDEPQHLPERILPSGTVELVINLSEDQVQIHVTFLVRVRLGELDQVWPHSEPLTLGHNLCCDRGFLRLRDQACERGSGPKVLPLWIYIRTAFRLSYRFS